MKKSVTFSLFSLQALILLIAITNLYVTFTNKVNITHTQKSLLETQVKLEPTFNVMAEIEKAKLEQEEAQRPLEKGALAPSFTLQNENEQEVKLETYKGKQTLLVFTQPDCPYCEKFYPILNKFQDERQDINVVIMQIDATPSQNKQFKKAHKINAPILAITYKELQTYKIQHTPTSILIDEKGEILGTTLVFRELEGLLHFVDNPTIASNNQNG